MRSVKRIETAHFGNKTCQMIQNVCGALQDIASVFALPGIKSSRSRAALPKATKVCRILLPSLDDHSPAEETFRGVINLVFPREFPYFLAN